MSRSAIFSIYGVISVFLLTVLPVLSVIAQSTDDNDSWIDLFNGKDLSGWETWLSRAPGEQRLLGLNNDPLKVFTVEDGALHISGQVFGALTTVEEYENYHLRLEYRWGEKKWPPRLDRERDSGVLYHATGQHGLFAGSWMKSNQFQIGEGATGDFWSVAGTMADVEAERIENDWRYAPGKDVVTIERGRVVASEHRDKPHGEWNTVEIAARGDSVQHIVNGEVVLALTRTRHKEGTTEQPLTRGKIQLQSEGAEIWFRNIQIKPLEE